MVFQLSNECADYIKSHLPEELQQPRVAIVCGSGLGGIVNGLAASPRVVLPYESLPGFSVSTVVGHAGKLVVGLVGDNRVPVVLMLGRFHFYEGHDMAATAYPVRVFAQLGIKTLIATNAAGGLRSGFQVGDLMVLNDHLNMPGLVGFHPLRGSNDDRFGVRFPPLSDAYSLELRQGVRTALKELGISRNVHEGTYAFVCGPTYETRTEVRYLTAVGADAVGMSTIPEVIVARHSGLDVLAISLITNVAVSVKPPSAHSAVPATSMEDGMANHQEVLDAALEAANDIQAVIVQVVNKL
ncbi:purine nucleoside phosphorylase-like protein [Nadsonia fulvescens var. elongata DSM 6958]|uniref:Purine nucleoside phosphorylase n=1 Tax=Nadsonia fulvescens var. elongata DSM 6958 TaxID=857566 RepID=A0A1E3PE47_9ASCO|nr:purine nucleoside phosphorylase-like protein [Nadsonia fulvescens var. elongata DSM 6958]